MTTEQWERDENDTMWCGDLHYFEDADEPYYLVGGDAGGATCRVDFRPTPTEARAALRMGWRSTPYTQAETHAHIRKHGSVEECEAITPADFDGCPGCGGAHAKLRDEVQAVLPRGRWCRTCFAAVRSRTEAASARSDVMTTEQQWVESETQSEVLQVPNEIVMTADHDGTWWLAPWTGSHHANVAFKPTVAEARAVMRMPSRKPRNPYTREAVHAFMAAEARTEATPSGEPPWFRQQVAAAGPPPGWSIRLRRVEQRDGEPACLYEIVAPNGSSTIWTGFADPPMKYSDTTVRGRIKFHAESRGLPDPYAPAPVQPVEPRRLRVGDRVRLNFGSECAGVIVGIVDDVDVVVRWDHSGSDGHALVSHLTPVTPVQPVEPRRFQVGDRVVSKYSGRTGSIEQVRMEGTVDLQYDDGSTISSKHQNPSCFALVTPVQQDGEAPYECQCGAKTDFTEHTDSNGRPVCSPCYEIGAWETSECIEDDLRKRGEPSPYARKPTPYVHECSSCGYEYATPDGCEGCKSAYAYDPPRPTPYVHEGATLTNPAGFPVMPQPSAGPACVRAGDMASTDERSPAQAGSSPAPANLSAPRVGDIVSWPDHVDIRGDQPTEIRAGEGEVKRFCAKERLYALYPRRRGEKSRNGREVSIARCTVVTRREQL